MIEAPYIIFFYYLFLLSLFEKNGIQSIDKNIDVIRLSFFYCFFILFFGFRGYIGNDWINYKYFYDKIPEGFSIKDIYLIQREQVYESGWNYFSILCRYFGFDYLQFQLVNFLLDIFLLSFIVHRYAKDYVLLFFCLFLPFQGYTFSLIILRNSKAIYLFILSIKYIKNRSFFKFLFFFLLGYSFHKSMVICFPLYFILNKKWNKKVLLLFFIVGNIFFLLQVQWLKLIISIVLDKLPNTGLSIMTEAYLNSDSYSRAFGITIGYIERFFTFCLFYRYFDILIGKEGENRVEVNCYFIFIFLFLYCSEFYIIIERIPNYFIFTYWIFYSKLFDKFDKTTKTIFYLGLLLYGTLRIWITVDEPCYYYENVLTGISPDVIRLREYGP